MEGIYDVSSSERVKSLDRELDRELRDLQNEIEEGNFLDGKDPPESFSSFHTPKDIHYYINQRKYSIKSYLQIREAKSLQSQAEIMEEEIKSCTKNEYTSNSLPLLLHQFYLKRVKELILLKHLHMLRWTRFCQHTKVIEGLYPEYSKRMNEILLEYQDALERARRLSCIHEAYLTNSSLPISVIKNKDVLVYARWLICHFHAAKKIHAFLQVLQWIPQTYVHLDLIYEQMKYYGRNDMTEEIVSSDHSLPNKADDISSKSSEFFSSECKFHEPKQDIKFVPLRTVAVWKRKAATARERGMLRKYRPILSTDVADFSVLLDFLLTTYRISMSSSQLGCASDEMDMFNVVFDRFKEVHFQQEQDRTYPIYGIVEEQLLDSGSNPVVYKRESNWLPFIQIKPVVDGTQTASLTKLKQQNHNDELLLVQSKIFHVESAEKILHLMKEHVKQIRNRVKMQPTYVSTHRKGRATCDIWKKLFDVSRMYTSKTNVLEFDSKIKDDNIDSIPINDSSLKLAENEKKDENNHSVSGNGALLSLMLLKHLKIKDHRQTCLCILNYFRSIERTLTIDDVGLFMSDDVLTPPPKHVSHDSDMQGIGSRSYLHNTPVDYAINADELMGCSNVENHDDFYIFRQDNIYVQDEHGQFIIYDSAFKDFSALEEELLLVGSHFLGCGNARDETLKAFSNEFDLRVFGSDKVDRFSVLLDLWGNEASFLESKRTLVDCFLEVYHHITCVDERRKIAQIIITIMYKRPRIDFSAEYFVTSYSFEIKLLKLYFQLVKCMIDEHIDDQRLYIHRLQRDEEKQFGIPFQIVQIQNIAVNHSQPALKNIFMLEFHPSLAIISSVPAALDNAFQQMLHEHPPRTTLERIKLEIDLFEVSLEKWKKKTFMAGFNEKVGKELLGDVFVEDPLFVSEIGDSLNPLKKIRGRTITKDEVQKMIDQWGTLLDVITFRYRLVLALNESNVLLDIYQKNASSLGYDTCHANIRPSSFERTLAKEDASVKPLVTNTNKLLLDDNKVDKYSPSQAFLAMSDLDDKHMNLSTFSNRDGLISNLQKDSLEKMKLILLVQICHKNLFVSVLHQIQSCRNVLRCSRLSHLLLQAPNPASKNTMFNQLVSKLKTAFVSVQSEKMFYRDGMLNDFVKMVERKGLQKVEEIVRAKKEVIQSYCYNLQKSICQHVIRAQIIAYHHSLVQLFDCFPVIKNSHFIIGEENETKKNVPDELKPEADSLKKRPRRFLSNDGQQILNLWFIPHFTEILTMYQKLDDDKCTEILKVVLLLTSSLHDICQYLCAHAGSGSLRSRKGKEMELSDDTADWGGAEGIGSELQEIQRQINLLEDPTDPRAVAEFLVYKRDVMFLEFDITVNYTVPNVFLATGNVDAFKCISTWSGIQKLGNLNKPSFTDHNLELPEPLSSGDSKTKDLFPWRHFVSRYGFLSGSFNQFYNIALNMKLQLVGLHDFDKRTVHGEFLGVALLLEDVLAAGVPYISQEKKETNLNSRKESLSREKIDEEASFKGYISVATTPYEKEVGNKAIHNSPVEAIKFLRTFLRRWSQVENLKRIWGCQRLHVTQICSTKNFKSFLHLFNTEVMEPIYKRFLSREDSMSFEMESKETDRDQLHLPSNITEYELKIHQFCRLLENIEIMMIQDCIRKTSRENTQVVAERARADHMLPTDLWKNANVKENVAVPRPHLVEKFIDDLKIDCDGEVLTFDKNHFDNCLMKLANACFIREKSCYLNYATFYENLLQHHNQLLYLKEQEIKRLNDMIESSKMSTSVEVDCGLADKSFELLIEVTALRAKVNDLQKVMSEKEVSMRSKIRELYDNLVLDLFNNAFGMVTKFDVFQLSLYDDVMHELTDTRRNAVEKMKNVNLKYHTKVDNSDSIRLINAEKLRQLQSENRYYVTMLTKFRRVNQWKMVKDKTFFDKQLRNAEKILSNAKHENTYISSIHEEKEKLMKEEKNELRKLLVSLERECESLRKQLDKEQKLQAQRAHIQLQEKQSISHIRTAKASSWERLETDLISKEKELRFLKDSSLRDREQSARSVSEMRRLLRQSTQQVQDERKLKLEAYGRVDELQKQIAELEIQITDMVSKDKTISTHETCFPLVPGGRCSPHRPKSRSQQGVISMKNRPQSSIPLTRRSGSNASNKPVTPTLKAKSEMFVSGFNWSPNS